MPSLPEGRDFDRAPTKKVWRTGFLENHYGTGDGKSRLTFLLLSDSTTLTLGKLHPRLFLFSCSHNNNDDRCIRINANSHVMPITFGSRITSASATIVAVTAPEVEPWDLVMDISAALKANGWNWLSFPSGNTLQAQDERPREGTSILDHIELRAPPALAKVSSLWDSLQIHLYQPIPLRQIFLPAVPVCPKSI